MSGTVNQRVVETRSFQATNLTSPLDPDNFVWNTTDVDTLRTPGSFVLHPQKGMYCRRLDSTGSVYSMKPIDALGAVVAGNRTGQLVAIDFVDSLQHPKIYSFVQTTDLNPIESTVSGVTTVRVLDVTVPAGEIWLVCCDAVLPATSYHVPTAEAWYIEHEDVSVTPKFTETVFRNVFPYGPSNTETVPVSLAVPYFGTADTTINLVFSFGTVSGAGGYAASVDGRDGATEYRISVLRLSRAEPNEL